MARPTNPARLLSRVLACALLSVALPLGGCGRTAGDGITGKSIRYEVEYFGSPQTGLAHRAVILSYSTPEGTRDEHNIGLPWNLVVGAAPARFTPSVKAQFYGYGTIVCRILADDEVIANTASAEEPYPTAECKA